MSPIQKEHSIELVSIIKDQVTEVLAYKQNTPQIEIDILKENIRKLYEIINSVNKVKIQDTVSTKQVESIDNEINELLDEATNQFKEQLKEEPDASLILEQEEVLEEQNIEDKIEPEIPDEETIAKVHEESIEGLKAEEKQDAKIKTEKKSKKVEVDKSPSKQGRTVHVLDIAPEDDEDSKEEEQIIIEKLKAKPIKSLKNGIGINDKFMIINDLFEGRAKDYNKCIQILDAQNDKETALFTLSDMKDENLWESNDLAYQHFKAYVERRYILS